MRPNQIDTPSQARVSRKITHAITLACCTLALASWSLWQRYLVGAVILAGLCLIGGVFLAIVHRAGNRQTSATANGGVGRNGAKTDSLISVIICSIDPVKYELVCANLRDRFGDSPYELIGIHDAKSLCEGYNRGVAKSRGEILIFCHDDIEIISPSFSGLVRKHLQAFDVIGCAGTTKLKDSKWMSSGDPYLHGVIAYPVAGAWPSDLFHLSMWGGIQLTQIKGVQALDGVFIAANRHVVESVRFDEETFDGFHGYDTDFSYCAFLRGFELAVCKDILIAHKSTVGDFEGIYKTYANRFWEKYKDHLPERESDGMTEQANFPYVNRAQMLKAWF
jgi:glycosyltransferase involved in cell wall biosynthesis